MSESVTKVPQTKHEMIPQTMVMPPGRYAQTFSRMIKHTDKLALCVECHGWLYEDYW